MLTDLGKTAASKVTISNLPDLFFGANSVYLQNDKINAKKVLLNLFYILKKSPMQHLGTFKSTAHL